MEYKVIFGIICVVTMSMVCGNVNANTTSHPIKCLSGLCNGTCEGQIESHCNSTTQQGCKVQTYKGGEHKFTCDNTGTCVEDAKTGIDCCFTENCNPFVEKSSASSVIGNLISVYCAVCLSFIHVFIIPFSSSKCNL